MAINISSLNNGVSNSSEYSIDYTKFKTPYFKVEIGKIGSSEMQELPPQIMKLVSKIEVMETIQGCNHNQITISFIEGSREPYKKEEDTEASIYQGGSFSNHTGFVVDLKQIDNSNGQPGFTLASTVGDLRSTLKAGQDVLNTVGDAASAAGLGGATATDEVDQESTKEVVDNEIPKYLFFPRNRVKVTWGYVEDPEFQRTFSGRITIMSTNFPENGHPVTNIVAHGTTSEFVQLTTKRGILFKSSGLFTQFSGSLSQEDEDMTLAELLDQIGNKTGFEIIRSDSFDQSKLDPGKAKVWPAGQSFHEFLSNLAKKHNAVYTAIEDFTTGKPAIVFIRREEFNSSTILPKNIMFYRQPGSILKSVNIKADFQNIVSKMNASVDENTSAINRGISTQGLEKLVLFEGQKALDTNPTNGKTLSPGGTGLDKLSDGGTINKIEYSADKEPSGLEQESIDDAACSYNHTVQLEFVAIGHPNLKPGSTPFQGLGRRYSGFYSIAQVSHIIDSNGYTCRGFATGAGTGGDGVTVSPKGQELNGTNSEAMKLFHKKTRTKVPSGGSTKNTILNRLID